MVRYAILGPIELRDGDRLVRVGGPRQVALLALLLIHANRVLSADRLIDALWSHQSPAVGLKSLYVAVSRLRKALDSGGANPEPALSKVAGGYLLAVRPGELDAEIFQARMQDGRGALDASDARRAREVLGEALGMWRGSALAEVAYEEFAQPEIRRLEELRLTVIEAWVDAGLQLGEHRGLIAELESVVASYPARERLAGQLMLALYRCGRQADALDIYACTRAYLSGELGLEPGPGLKALQAEILAQSPMLQQVSDQARDPRTIGVELNARRSWVRFNIPLPLAHFAGRTAELDAIDEALAVADRTVVTQAITGLGGVGKSQLAARYVHHRADEYAIVAWIRAEDGGIRDLSELAGALHLPVAQLTPAERTAAALRWLGGCDQRWLLVLDNVATPEQLADCCPTSGNGQVLITTRDRRIAQFGPVLAIDVFDEQTAVEYLLTTSGRAQDRDGATRLARAMGCLPLALSHAGAYCAAGTSFDNYLTLLQALPAAELFDSHPEAFYAQTVSSTWQVSIQAADEKAPLARKVLTMAAHLAPDAIPRELFEVLLDDAGSTAARKSLLDAFNALYRLSLAEIDDTAISVHRLLQKTIRDDALRRGDATAARNALTAVAEAFPSEHNDVTTWAQSERLLSHALAISATHPAPSQGGEQHVGLLNSASTYLLWAEAGAVDTATRASALAQRVLGPAHPATLTARGSVALSYWAAGRIDESLVLGQQLLADRERLLGDEHPDTLNEDVRDLVEL